MNPNETLELAKLIFALKAVLNPTWDIQQQARDSLNTAMQFSLAVQAEQGHSSTGSHSTSSHTAGQAYTDIAEPPPPADSTTGTAESTQATGSTAAATTDSGTAQSADTGSSQSQSQTQPDAPATHVQTPTQFAPVS